MKVLVAGGAGFIGSHTADQLVAGGDDVVILDDLSTGPVAHIPAKARFYQMSLDSPWLSELFAIEHPDAVIHLAAQASVRRSVDNPVYDAHVNVLGTIALLQASVQHGVRRFVFASSGGAIYGDTDMVPTPEDHPGKPVSPYGAAKLAGEAYLATFQAISGISSAAMRYANVYGPRQDPFGEANVVAIFAQRLLEGEEAVINGDGRQTRDFVYVADVVDATLRALASTETGAFNVGTGRETDINAIFSLLKGLTGSSQPERHGPPKAGEQRRSAVDPARAGSVLGWRPRTELKAGMEATVAYFRAQTQRVAP